ncbi:hypothetical protein C0Q70_04647 [Pomacea canaliculata]|uniref:Uncharacterized protein n=1 Tax=Pomacea canaliculata TaxID=400727 RepID=A0A2T7PIY1_POMCA|nr:hypothetical protein C0Q70_04647 [Pomacea canaliculata]
MNAGEADVEKSHKPPGCSVTVKSRGAGFSTAVSTLSYSTPSTAEGAVSHSRKMQNALLGAGKGWQLSCFDTFD